MNEPGLPVEIGRIDKELGKLWESGGDTKTRASLINLVIYSEDPGSLDANTGLLSSIASRHAFRAILILADPHAAESGARAWISAHCHLVGKGGHQVCSEQITFRLDGESVASLPNIVFSHLDSDLPLCFWSQAEFREPLDEQLWSWVDRLIFDSRTWSRPADQFALTCRIAALADSGAELCDLNWTRLQPWRFALANLFDHSAALPCLAEISSVRIACDPESHTTALLLVGWLASRLGWNLHCLLGETFFQDPKGRRVDFSTIPSDGRGVASVEIGGREFSFSLHRPPDSDFFHASLHAPGVPDSTLTLAAARERLSDTLLAELSRSGRHPFYRQALAAVEPLIREGCGMSGVAGTQLVP